MLSGISVGCVGIATAGAIEEVGSGLRIAAEEGVGDALALRRGRGAYLRVEESACIVSDALFNCNGSTCMSERLPSEAGGRASAVGLEALREGLLDRRGRKGCNEFGIAAVGVLDLFRSD